MTVPLLVCPKQTRTEIMALFTESKIYTVLYQGLVHQSGNSDVMIVIGLLAWQ
jgi:hypothetical protein